MIEFRIIARVNQSEAESAADISAAQARAQFVREAMPKEGLFAGMSWRVSPEPFLLSAAQVDELNWLGRVSLQFYRGVNQLYRQSVDGKQPRWIAELLEAGKPAGLIERQRSVAFKNELPRVIRPDLMLTEKGFAITELDSVPGGIGLTAWLNKTYSEVQASVPPASRGSEGVGENRQPDAGGTLIGGADGMLRGFESIFGSAAQVHIVVSEESATYRPEMEWVAAQLGSSKFKVQSSEFTDFQEGNAVYRFFELFDLANVANAEKIFSLAAEKKIRVTPPPKTIFEEKLLFALLWNRNLREVWRQALGEGFFKRLLPLVPYSWVLDPTPLPPHAAIPGLELTNWEQLKSLSQRERDLILKVSGFSAEAWGARGVYLGSDLSQGDWSAAVDKALTEFPLSPYVLQRFEKPKTVTARWYDFEADELKTMPARARLCPYYFVSGEGDAARTQLGGVLATLVPADKKIVHGMTDAILAPCAVAEVPPKL